MLPEIDVVDEFAQLAVAFLIKRQTDTRKVEKFLVVQFCSRGAALFYRATGADVCELLVKFQELLRAWSFR